MWRWDLLFVLDEKDIICVCVVHLFAPIFNMSVYGQNPIVYRLSQYEIDQCKTPSEVTYNFIQAILCRDFNKMMSYASPEYYSNVMRVINNRGLTYDEFFEEAFTSRGGDKLNILGWIPALTRNYEVAIAYVQDTWYYNENGSLYWNPDAIVRNGVANRDVLQMD